MAFIKAVPFHPAKSLAGQTHCLPAYCLGHYGSYTLHSGNMYQIFTYVKNKETELADRPHEVSGMLLYAKTDEDIYPENEYRMSGSRIEVRTLNLDGDFDMIKAQLDGIAEKYLGVKAA